MEEDKLEELQHQVMALLAFKERMEASQAKRLDELHNGIVQFLTDNNATVTEICTVLDLVKAEATRNYTFARKEAIQSENSLTAVREPSMIAPTGE